MYIVMLRGRIYVSHGSSVVSVIHCCEYDSKILLFIYWLLRSLTTGQLFKSTPDFSVCLVQAAAVYAAPALWVAFCSVSSASRIQADMQSKTGPQALHCLWRFMYVFLLNDGLFYSILPPTALADVSNNIRDTHSQDRCHLLYPCEPIRPGSIQFLALINHSSWQCPISSQLVCLSASL